MNNLIYDYNRYDKYNNFLDILKLYISSRAFKSVCLYRMSNYLYRRGFKKIAIIIKNKCIKETGCEIGESAEIGKGLKIGHSVGIVISGKSKIGENAVIQSGVIIGTNRDEIDKYPIIGKNCYIGAGAKILGNIKIGNNVIIGANSVVLKDINDDSVVVGVAGKEITKNNER